MTDKLDLTVGLRWTDESKDGAFEQLAVQSNACEGVLANAASFAGTPLEGLVPVAVALTCFPFTTRADLPGAGTPGGPPTPATFSDTFKDDELIYTLKAGYAFTSDVNAYASFTHGFKTGGFNLDASAAVRGTDPRFASELVDASEIGLKSDLMDGRARLNIALFDMDIEDFQVLEFTGTQFVTFNVDKVKSTGAEVEFDVAATDNLDLKAAVTYTDARYPDDCAPATASPSVLNLCGSSLTNAPEFVGIIGGTYDRAITASGMRLFATGSVRYESERRTGTQPTVTGTNNVYETGIQDENTKVNLRVGLQAPDRRWTLELWGNNIFDEQTQNLDFNVPFRGGSFLGSVLGPDNAGTRGSFLQEPATYGVTLRTEF